LKLKEEIGSGGRDRTADLGVMNPVLHAAPISLQAKTQQMNEVAVEKKRSCAICETKTDMTLDKISTNCPSNCKLW
jgi:hypothetical protein